MTPEGEVLFGEADTALEGYECVRRIADDIRQWRRGHHRPIYGGCRELGSDCSARAEPEELLPLQHTLSHQSAAFGDIHEVCGNPGTGRPQNRRNVYSLDIGIRLYSGRATLALVDRGLPRHGARARRVIAFTPITWSSRKNEA